MFVLLTSDSLIGKWSLPCRSLSTVHLKSRNIFVLDIDRSRDDGRSPGLSLMCVSDLSLNKHRLFSIRNCSIILPLALSSSQPQSGLWPLKSPSNKDEGESCDLMFTRSCFEIGGFSGICMEQIDITFPCDFYTFT